MDEKFYIGDSVYGEWTVFGELRLFLSNGYFEEHEIILDPHCLEVLEGILKTRRDFIKDKKEN